MEYYESCPECTKDNTCLESINMEFSEREKQEAWKKLRILADWHNPAFPDKETWFKYTNNAIRESALSIGGNWLLMTYKGILRNIPSGWYKGEAA